MSGIQWVIRRPSVVDNGVCWYTADDDREFCLDTSGMVRLLATRNLHADLDPSVATNTIIPVVPVSTHTVYFGFTPPSINSSGGRNISWFIDDVAHYQYRYTLTYTTTGDLITQRLSD